MKIQIAQAARLAPVTEKTKRRQMQDEAGRRLSNAIRAAMAKAGINQVKLASMTGLKQNHLSRLLSGQRNWNPLYIERVCRALKIDPWPYLTDQIAKIPVYGVLSSGSFRYLSTPLSQIALRNRKAMAEANTYAIEVGDDSLTPLVRAGAVIYVQQSPANLTPGDLVVYVDQEHTGRIYLLAGISDTQIRLSALNAQYPNLELPAKYLPILDRVIAIIWP